MWRKSHHLGKMTLRELIVAYAQHYAIRTYLLLAVAALALLALSPPPLLLSAGIAAFVVLFYPLAWYGLHRWVLHSQWMYKVPFLAGTWKRIHYDHHLDPDRLEVLVGALYTTIPTVVLISALPGWILGGTRGAVLAFAVGLLVTCFYEFCHCIQHLGYKPRNTALARMKARHMEHHFHDEDGNFGITNFLWDHLFGTYYERRQRPEPSPTVFNLGYTEAAARLYPHVARLSASDDGQGGGVRRRTRGAGR